MPEQQADNFVEIRGLHFSRGDHVIFAGVDLDIPRGSITAIMGPSGTGKTTLLRLIGGQLRPQQGSIKVAGMEITSMARSDLHRVRRKIGMLFQSGALFTDMSVFDNVAFPLRAHSDLPAAAVRDLVLMKLQAVGLRGAADMMPCELSGGMARRVALARTISLDPEMIMYDEPFTGQDPISLGMVADLIGRFNHSLGLTTLIVSHEIHKTIELADQICVLMGAKVAALSSPAQLFNSEAPEIRQFIHGEPDGPASFHVAAPNYRHALLGTG